MKKTCFITCPDGNLFAFCKMSFILLSPFFPPQCLSLSEIAKIFIPEEKKNVSVENFFKMCPALVDQVDGGYCRQDKVASRLPEEDLLWTTITLPTVTGLPAHQNTGEETSGDLRHKETNHNR